MRTEYERFCRENTVPLHHQPWWLDAVCAEGGWIPTVAAAASGEIGGIMPVFLQKKWGLSFLQPAPLTCYGGPWLSDAAMALRKPNQRYHLEKQVVTDLIGHMPRTHFQAVQLHPRWTNWLPFYWEGFQQTTRYTYVLPPAATLAEAEAAFKNTVRTDLKKAEKNARVVRDDAAVESIFRLHTQSLERKKMRSPTYHANFLRLHAALQARQQSACWIAVEPQHGVAIAGLYLTWDAQRAGVLLTGLHPAFRHTCASHLLYREAIRWCLERGIALDLEGSMDRGMEHLFRALGAEQVPYFRVTRAANRVFWAIDLWRRGF